MNSLTFLAGSITETAATEAIFDACRANPERNTVFVGKGETKVSFTRLALDVGIGQRYEACLRNEEGVVVALANIDDSDI